MRRSPTASARSRVIVALESKGDKDVLGDARRARSPCMSPRRTRWRSNAAGLDPAVVAREKAVLAEKNAGKPANVLEKIVESGLKTYYKEVCLLDQAFDHPDHAARRSPRR